MIKKILLGLLAFIIIGLISGYFYFTAGSETYPEVLAEGRAAPDFIGTDQRGQQLQLSELTRKGPVVLIFYRGLWCPACQKHLGELQASLDQFMAMGASVIAVTPEQTEQTNQSIPVTSTSISIIHDENNEIMESYQVGYRLGTGSLRLFDVMGINLEEANGNDQNLLPIPALYLVGEDGNILYSYEKAGGMVPEYLPVADILDKLSD
ncbi:MAG: AhpC/TSA family protein [Roseivirga sp.]|nr:AhpC/TSA family protein [Roseivirga sp.]